MKLGSLFDGIGGFPLAAIRNGIIPIWASEIEPFPIKVTKIRIPSMIHFGDITKLDGAKLPPVDIICGGSPCQDLSVAGKRAGLAGERSGLFMEQIRITKEMREADEKRDIPNELIRPRYFIWENVPGAFSSENGEDFRSVVEEITRIKKSSCDVPRPEFRRWESAGTVILGDEFSLAWRVLDAQFWGVPQRRRRIFLIADFGGLTAPQILFKQDSLFGDNSQSKGKGQRTSATIKRSVNDTSRDYLTSNVLQDISTEDKNIKEPKHKELETNTEKVNSFHINQRNEVIDLQGVSGALLATTNMQMQTFVAKEPLICLNDHGGERMDITEEITPTLRASMSGHPPLVMATQQGGAEISVGICPTITASAGMSGNNQPVVLYENHAKDCRYTGPLKVAPTVTSTYGTGGNNVPLVENPITLQRNFKSSNTEAICIAGNTIDREPQNGGNGCGYQKDISYTLTSTDKHAIFNPQGHSSYAKGYISATQYARQYKGGAGLISTYQDVVGALCKGDEKGPSNQYVSQDKCIVENRKLIRRLTPLECERLQGFQDGWTLIEGASDSSRYKALGNSVAIPCVEFIMRGIAYFLRKIYEEYEEKHKEQEE